MLSRAEGWVQELQILSRGGMAQAGFGEGQGHKKMGWGSS